MVLRSLVTIKGIIEGLTGGSVNIGPADIQNLTPPQFTLQDSLVSGDNIIPVPDLAIGCLIIFDSTSTVVKKLKGAGGDTGIITSKVKPVLLTFDSPSIVSFIINCSANDTGKYTTIIFF